MRVSVLINSHNYARYVGATIDSALAQSAVDTEVIVVDDGSTDGSWDLIAAYGTTIRAVRQANAGQAAAYNTAMAMARGEWVLFLDSDDLLDPGAIEACAPAMADARVAKVQFRLRVVDESGAPTGAAVPYLMHSGDLRALVHDFGLYAGPPGSGNLYRRAAIEACFPIDPDPWRRGGADTLPYVACVYAGQVVSLRGEHGSYRIHRGGHPLGLFGNADVPLDEALRRDIDATDRARRILERQLSLTLRAPLLPTPTQLRARVLSWKLHRATHPCRDDDAAGLAALVGEVLRRWPGYTAPERWLLRAWFIAMLVLPSAVAQRLSRNGLPRRVKGVLRRARS